MRKPRFALSTLSFAIAMAALAFAAARLSGWTATIFTISAIVLVAATLIAFVETNECSRRFWLGFAVVGWCYFIMHSVREGNLLTTDLLFHCFWKLKHSDWWAESGIRDSLDERNFLTMGHSFLTVCFAILGGALMKWMFRTRETRN